MAKVFFRMNVATNHPRAWLLCHLPCDIRQLIFYYCEEPIDFEIAIKRMIHEHIIALKWQNLRSADYRREHAKLKLHGKYMFASSVFDKIKHIEEWQSWFSQKR